MVYGKHIRIPGEFFDEPRHYTDKDELVKRLQRDMLSLQPLKTRINKQNNTYVHKDLSNCSHVFLRRDRLRKPLEPVYEGPFKVSRRDNKNFTIHIKNKEETVSIDRLKPAYLLSESADSLTPPPDRSELVPEDHPKTQAKKVQFQPSSNTRSGRAIHPPQRFTAN